MFLAQGSRQPLVRKTDALGDRDLVPSSAIQFERGRAASGTFRNERQAFNLKASAHCDLLSLATSPTERHSIVRVRANPSTAAHPARRLPSVPWSL
jgi:hypothetical protein